MARLQSELQPARINPTRWHGTAGEQEERMTKLALRAHPIAELVPDMTPDQYGALRDDIREHGLRTPTVMYEGMVLDGRNRSRAWYDIHGNWDVPSTEFKGTPEEAIAYVRSHNIKRRHLKPSQIAYYEAQAAAFWKAQARPDKEFRQFRDAEANCQGGWRQYRDHRARRQGSKGRARGWSLPARRQDQRQPRAEGCQTARRRALRCAHQATAAPTGRAQAAADTETTDRCLCQWLARGSRGVRPAGQGQRQLRAGYADARLKAHGPTPQRR